jgi:MHS family proline/betaine transporter-like MFS transporter
MLHIALTTNILEWYEFSISGYLSVVIGELFFRPTTDLAAIMLGFAVFAVSYLARPLGSLFFGYISNLHGIVKSLRLSVILMAFPTVIIGILPIYKSVGYISTILLIILRLIQGFAAGGELPISAYYVYQNATKNKSVLCAMVNSGSLIGVLFGSFTVYLIYLIFPQSTINSWAWRIPFLFGLPLLVIVIYIRRSIQQASQLNNSIENHNVQQVNITPIIRFAKAISLIAFLQVSFYTLFIWFPTYLQYFLDIPISVTKIGNVLALTAMVMVTLISGYLANFIGHNKIIKISLIMNIIFIYPLFILLQSSSVATLLIVQLCFAIMSGLMNGAIIMVLCTLFSNYMQSAGVAISFTIPTTLFGATAPIICTYFTHALHLNSFPALYIIFFSTIALLINCL